MTLLKLMENWQSLYSENVCVLIQDTLGFTTYSDIFHSNLELGILSHRNTIEIIKKNFFWNTFWLNHVPIYISRDSHIYAAATGVCRKIFTCRSYNGTLTIFNMCDYIIYFKLLKSFGRFHTKVTTKLQLTLILIHPTLTHHHRII